MQLGCNLLLILIVAGCVDEVPPGFIEDIKEPEDAGLPLSLFEYHMQPRLVVMQAPQNSGEILNPCVQERSRFVSRFKRVRIVDQEG
jgi:hypothetical protein